MEENGRYYLSFRRGGNPFKQQLFPVSHVPMLRMTRKQEIRRYWYSWGPTRERASSVPIVGRQLIKWWNTLKQHISCTAPMHTDDIITRPLYRFSHCKRFGWLLSLWTNLLLYKETAEEVKHTGTMGAFPGPDVEGYFELGCLSSSSGNTTKLGD